MGKIEICNTALITIGDAPITGFPPADGSKRAQQCAAIYDDVRRSVLRAHPWSSSVRAVILSPDSDPPAFGFSYSFTMPGDCLRVLSISDDFEEYVIRGRKIWCNINIVELTYIFDNDNESTYDSLMTSAMSWAMASRLSYAIPNSASLMQMMESKFQETIEAAKSMNGLEYPFDGFPESVLITNRSIG